MARKLRIQYEGAIYHVMNRGDHREDIFRTDHDRHLFLHTLGQACAKTDWLIHAWCLMPNHFHLVIETPKANLVAGMKWLLGTYTARFNRRHKLSGHLFAGRYKALPVEGSGNGYLRTACDYVHLNPVRAKMLTSDQKLSHYPWSSYRDYLKAPARRYPWLQVQRLLGEHGIPKDTPAGRAEFENRMEARRRAETGEEFNALQRGWCCGSEAFRQELLAQMNHPASTGHYGAELREAAQAKAERLLRQELQKAGWAEPELARRRKGDPRKVKIALRLRRETTMTMAWLAQRLQMGTRTYLTHLLYWQGREKKKNEPRVYNTRD